MTQLLSDKKVSSMVLGGMKTYNIELSNTSNGIIEYIDFLQETGIARVPLTTSAQLCKVSRYIVFHIYSRPLSSGDNYIYINGETTYLDSSTDVNPGLYTHINGNVYSLEGVYKNMVFAIDLEKVAQYSEIAIENITSIGFNIIEDY